MIDNNDSKQERGRGGTDWMLTFADLLSLLLTFFVLLFSMTIVRVEEWESIVESMSRQFNPERVLADIEDIEDQETVAVDRERGLNLSYLENLMLRTLGSSELLQGVLLGRSDGQVILSVPGPLLFDPNSVSLRPEGMAALEVIAGRLVQIPNVVRIAGHAAPSAIGDYGPFRTAWDLTLARSRIVAKILKDNGYRRDVTIVGYGTSRFSDLRGDLSSREREALADRVDIVIIRDDGRGGSQRFL